MVTPEVLSHMPDPATFKAREPSYSEVAKACAGINRPGWFGFKERGGNTRKDIEPRRNYREYERAANYHVETSFSEEQLPHIRASLAYMTALAKGIALDEPETTLPTFTERIISNYTNPEMSYDFSESVAQAAFSLIRDFKKHYPNRMPAVNGIFKVAGAEGMQMVVNMASRFLGAAKSGEMTEENINTFWENNPRISGHEPFTKTHPTIHPDKVSREYEVWCTGEGFARELIGQTKQAALDIVNSEIQVNDLKQSTTKYARIQKYVARVAKETAREQQPSFIRKLFQRKNAAA